MEREVQAVDSEFNQVLQNESCRLEQFHCHTAAPGHPFNKFFWGNKKNLVDAMENGINLCERILKLYRDYYHGGLMKLVVIGGERVPPPVAAAATSALQIPTIGIGAGPCCNGLMHASINQDRAAIFIPLFIGCSD
ncbi:hypothetical protein Pyn_14490 [Prunus yedoensis var. nudiflora]|uniref:Uncharacterized protein n=1 Tax=Prunus yedoensis var. nudiflora TaxID=2094558 RepID=A0A314XTU5_PRUYE|nr:hypothetical protein Pyn_14490 [Prunus yedoensis var. nudiflora]